MLIDIFTYSASTAHGVFGVEELIEAARRAHLDGIGITGDEFAIARVCRDGAPPRVFSHRRFGARDGYRARDGVSGTSRR